MGHGSQTMQSQSQGAGVLRLEAKGLGQGLSSSPDFEIQDLGKIFLVFIS